MLFLDNPLIDQLLLELGDPENNIKDSKAIKCLSSLHVGDIVWAQFKPFPAWPERVNRKERDPGVRQGK